MRRSGRVGGWLLPVALALSTAAMAGETAPPATPAAVESHETAMMTIGDVTLRVPVPPGYMRASERAPVLFAGSAAALPPAIRLVEAMVTGDDLKRTALGEGLSDPYVQVQTPRDAEYVAFTAAEWVALQPALAAQLGALDLSAEARRTEDASSERMRAATGADIAMRYDDVGRAHVYDQRPTSLHYRMRLSIVASVGGEERPIALECVGAMGLAAGRLVMVNAYAPASGDGDVPFAAAQGLAEAMFAGLQALNPTPAGPADGS